MAAQEAAGNGKPIAPLTDKQLDLIANIVTSRSQLFRQLTDPRRNYDDECGYPATSSVTPQRYWELYERGPIAARVVEIMPNECWQVQPLVYEDENPDVETEFEKAWDGLVQGLRGEQSWFQDQEGSSLWEYTKRLDVLSGIGRFGLLLLGFDDGLDLSQPVAGLEDDTSSQSPLLGTDIAYQPATFGRSSKAHGPAAGSKSTAGRNGQRRKLLYMRVFPEHLVRILSSESRRDNPRFGQPVWYGISLVGDASQQGGVALPVEEQRVHWSRVIHAADNLTSSEVYGTPRMLPVLNRLLDVDQKLTGGSAEMYWRGAFPGYTLETLPQALELPADDGNLREAMETWMHGLQRYLRLTGMTMKSQAPQVVDPTAQINVQIDAICIKLAIPKRIFMGSERGELASSQDKDTWNERKRERQNGYITPRLIVPLVDRLIQVGALPQPKGYSVYWPGLDTQSEDVKAGISLKLTQALAAYVGGNVEQVLPVVEFLTRIMHLSDEEAQAIYDAAVSEQENMLTRSDGPTDFTVDRRSPVVPQQIPGAADGGADGSVGDGT